MELLSYNVGILNVSPIIQSVLHLAGLDYDKLPERTTINEILIESRSLAHNYAKLSHMHPTAHYILMAPPNLVINTQVIKCQLQKEH